MRLLAGLLNMFTLLLPLYSAPSWTSKYVYSMAPYILCSWLDFYIHMFTLLLPIYSAPGWTSIYVYSMAPYILCSRLDFFICLLYGSLYTLLQAGLLTMFTLWLPIYSAPGWTSIVYSMVLSIFVFTNWIFPRYLPMYVYYVKCEKLYKKIEWTRP